MATEATAFSVYAAIWEESRATEFMKREAK
jgi:hypothetical protein